MISPFLVTELQNVECLVTELPGYRLILFLRTLKHEVDVYHLPKNNGMEHQKDEGQNNPFKEQYLSVLDEMIEQGNGNGAGVIFLKSDAPIEGEGTISHSDLNLMEQATESRSISDSGEERSSGLISSQKKTLGPNKDGTAATFYQKLNQSDNMQFAGCSERATSSDSFIHCTMTPEGDQPSITLSNSTRGDTLQLSPEPSLISLIAQEPGAPGSSKTESIPAIRRSLNESIASPVMKK